MWKVAAIGSLACAACASFGAGALPSDAGEDGGAPPAAQDAADAVSEEPADAAVAPGDGATAPLDAGECANRCGVGSVCTKTGCRVTEGSCNAPVVVGELGGTFYGTACADTPAFIACGTAVTRGPVFETGAAPAAGHAVSLYAVIAGTNMYPPSRAGTLQGSCQLPSCVTYGGSSSAQPIADAPASSLYGVGWTAEDTTTCTSYVVTFTPK